MNPGDISRPLEKTEDTSIESAAAPSRYRRLRRFWVAVASLVALTPLFIMTAFNIHKDRVARQAEVHYSVAQTLSTTKRALEFIIEERRAALTLLVSERGYEELSREGNLSVTFQNMRTSFGGFVDLGIIDSHGNQQRYTGPYSLEGYNYADQAWFQEVCLRGIYVSDVFMGFRNFPHFVIAVRHEKLGNDFFVLRATIDMDMLIHEIQATSFRRTLDVFLINRDGVLQTPSRIYGGVLSHCPITLAPVSAGQQIIEEIKTSDGRVTLGFSGIEKSPFTLMVTHRPDSSVNSWFSLRNDLIWFLLVSSLAILILVFYSGAFIVRRVREADLRRARVFHNIEYTNKMATVGRMAASVAHEINNPLAIINEKAGLLKDIIAVTPDLPRRDKVAAAVDSIIRSVERCSVVTHRLLGFARRMEPQLQSTDLKSLITEVLGFLANEFAHRNIKVNVDAQGDLPMVESDRGQLQQVFLN
ncbi:MAG: cache domain-containing protein, partial [Calditrichota bacterium]